MRIDFLWAQEIQIGLKFVEQVRSGILAWQTRAWVGLNGKELADALKRLFLKRYKSVMQHKLGQDKEHRLLYLHFNRPILF